MEVHALFSRSARASAAAPESPMAFARTCRHEATAIGREGSAARRRGVGGGEEERAGSVVREMSSSVIMRECAGEEYQRRQSYCGGGTQFLSAAKYAPEFEMRSEASTQGRAAAATHIEQLKLRALDGQKHGERSGRAIAQLIVFKV